MEIIILQGEPASGKTFSLRNLDPTKGGVIAPSSKPLSIPNGAAIKQVVIPELKEIPEMLRMGIKSGAKWLVVEDFNHWLSRRTMSQEFHLAGQSKNPYARYSELARDIYASVFTMPAEFAGPEYADTMLVLIAHTQEEAGRKVFKTAGQLVDKEVKPIGHTRIALHAVVANDDPDLRKRYKFLTNEKNGLEARSPYGMFPSDLIGNDLNKVFHYVREFNAGRPAIPYVELEEDETQNNP